MDVVLVVDQIVPSENCLKIGLVQVREVNLWFVRLKVGGPIWSTRSYLTNDVT